MNGTTLGCPTLLTPEVHEKIVALVRSGNFPETAAAASGVSRPALRVWMREGAILERRISSGQLDRPSKYQRALVAFLSDLLRAFGDAETRDVMLIGKAGIEDWRALAWRLERRNRQQWSTLQRVEATAAVATVDTSQTGEDARTWVLEKIKQLSEIQLGDGDDDEQK